MRRATLAFSAWITASMARTVASSLPSWLTTTAFIKGCGGAVSGLMRTMWVGWIDEWVVGAWRSGKKA